MTKRTRTGLEDPTHPSVKLLDKLGDLNVIRCDVGVEIAKLWQIGNLC